MNSNIDKGKGKKYKLWEKIFIFGSIFFICLLIGIYAYRLIHYYLIEHTVVSNGKFYDVLTVNNVVYAGDGLYGVDDGYYYKGNDVNNYVWYSGRMWRIISLDNDYVKMITDDVQTSLVWGYNSSYSDSYIYRYLNDTGEDLSGVFVKSLSNVDNYIAKTSWCYSTGGLSDLNCDSNSVVNDYVGLISVSEYLKAGGADSYLNNGTYWWTMDVSSLDNVWYVFDQGGLNSNSKSDSSYYSYGVRPVVNVLSNVSVFKGSGSKDDPYIIESEVSALLGHKNIGSYVNYKNYRWRIIENDKEKVKIILDDLVYEGDNKYLSYYSNNSANYSSSNAVVKYLKDNFYKDIESNIITNCDYYYGVYGKDNKYDYKSVYSKKINDYIGIPSILDLFITDYSDYWLSNSNNSSYLLAYKMSDDGSLYADDISSVNGVRPMVCIDGNAIVTEGDGLFNNPYVVGE